MSHHAYLHQLQRDAERVSRSSPTTCGITTVRRPSAGSACRPWWTSSPRTSCAPCRGSARPGDEHSRSTCRAAHHRAPHPARMEAQSPRIGLDTAVHAEVSSEDFDTRSHRTIAVMSEYDTLPGIGHGSGTT
ncbi:hypothetical protein QJS66_16300 [Kocuria rhizophila]|nr:hypothetical protein QJS66_16300 [Kocuria rhizophila]